MSCANCAKKCVRGLIGGLRALCFTGMYECREVHDARERPLGAMSRIAAPIVGGMLSVAVLTLVVIPAAYLLWHHRLRVYFGFRNDT